jgi:hypothetical protein
MPAPVILPTPLFNFGDAARLLWPCAHNRGLSRFAGVPLDTARCWVRGRRRPPVRVLSALERRLAEVANEAATLRLFLSTEVARREREPRKPRGFMRHRGGHGANAVASWRFRGRVAEPRGLI